MPVVELPDGTELEFPEEMTRDQMRAAIKSKLSAPKKASEALYGEPGGETLTAKEASDIESEAQTAFPTSRPGFLKELGSGLLSAPRATAGAAFELTHSDEDLKKHLLDQFNAAGREGEPTKAGKVGQFIGGTVSSIGEGLVAGATGGPTGIAGAFGAIGAYNAFVKAGTRAIAQGLDLDQALLIAKKAALVNAPVQAAVTFALPASRALNFREALKQGGRSALAGGAGQVVENVTEKALGLPTPLLEGVPQAALTMGGLPLASHALAQIPSLLRTPPPFRSTLPPMPAEEVAPVLPPVEQAATGALPPKAPGLAFPATEIAETGLNVTQEQWDKMQDWQRDNVMQEIAARRPDFQRASERSDLGAGAAKAVGSGPSQAEIAPPVETAPEAKPAEVTPDDIRKQLYAEAESAKQKAQAEWPSIHDEVIGDSGLPTKTVEDALNLPPREGATHPSDYKNLPERLSHNYPGGYFTSLYNKLAPEQNRGKFLWGGTYDKPEIGFDAYEQGGTPDVEATQKAYDAFNRMRKQLGMDELTDLFGFEKKGGGINESKEKGQEEVAPTAAEPTTGTPPPAAKDVTEMTKAEFDAHQKKFSRLREQHPMATPEELQRLAGAETTPERAKQAEEATAVQAKAQGQLPGTEIPTVNEIQAQRTKVKNLEKKLNRQTNGPKAGWLPPPIRAETQIYLSAQREILSRMEKAYREQPGAGGPQALGIAPGQAAVKAIGEKLSSIRSKLANSWGTRGNKADIARLKDAADNQARILAAQQGKSVLLEARRIFSGQARQALKAVIPVIESGGDRSRLPQFIAQSRTHFEARKAAEFAEANWDRLQPLAAKIKAIHDAQIAQENAHGIATEYRENYIKHAFDVEKLPNRGQEFFGSGGAGARSGFKAARKFETVYDAIEAGYGKALKSLDADKLTQSRLASGQQLINDRQWINGFRGIADPTTGKPLLNDVTFDRNHFPIAPPGYDAVQVLPGQFIAVHNGYGKIFKAVTGDSKIAQGEVAGLPVGELILNTAAGIKHGLLLFDTFHASRIMQKQFFLTGKVGWNKGLSLLDYTDADLNEAVRQGEITTDMANYARANRGTAQLLLREGLNVGRIQEALRNEVVRNLPVVGAFNRLVFDKITRGAMMESALIEFERVRANNPGMTPQAAAAMTAKKINVTFGNIGRQGLFKSRTMQDLSRLLALAPQWVESMARSEVGGFKELGQVPVDLALGKGLQVGTLGKTMAGGLLAYVVGTQLLNLATRGQFTWQNKEEGHKLDAWIPDVTGKTPGFFLNPLSVVAELTHDAYRYAFKSDSAIDIAGEILNNKMSPLARSQKIFWSGKNYSGEKIDGTWKRIKESAAALTPAPIPVSGFNSGRPGQAQRQLTASAGIKTEPATTATKQIAGKAARFVADKGRPKEVDLVYHEDSPHNALRNAIARGDEEAAMQAIATLRKTQTDAKICQAWRQTLTHPFTGSAAMEAKFRQSLSEDDKQLYDAAKKERQARFTAFHALWAKRAAR